MPETETDTQTQEPPADADADAAGDAAVEAQEAELPQAEPSQADAPAGQMDLLLDATVSVSARLGQVEMEIGELLQLGPGSVVKLDRQAGEPVDLFLRGVRFATGRLMVVGERLGVQIQEILPPSERTRGGPT